MSGEKQGAALEAPASVGGPFLVRWENVTDSPGWLDMWVGTSVNLCAGHPDPYPGLVRWVEECCVEQKSASFHWDSDGFEFLFSYVFSCNYLRVEEITLSTRPKTVWAGHVTMKELCAGFYQGLLRFAADPVFNAARWCLIPLREWLEWLAGGSISDLEEQWLECGSHTLEEHLDEIAEYAEARNEGASECRFPSQIRARLPLYQSKRAFIWELQLAKEWDASSTEERKGMLQEFLAQDVGTGYGVHPRTLRSPQLDAWWEERKDDPDF